MRTARIKEINDVLDNAAFIGHWEYKQIIRELLREVTVSSPDLKKLKRDMMRLLKDNKKIAAIKLYRREMGVGLREAVDFTNSLMSTSDSGRKVSWRTAEKTVQTLGVKKRLRHRPAPKSKKKNKVN